MSSRNKILSFTVEYLSKIWPDFKSDARGKSKMLLCPYCKRQPLSARFFPILGHKITCLSCNKTYYLTDLVKLFEPETVNFTEEEILGHVRDYLDLEIKTDDEIANKLKLYKDNGFSLVPIAKNAKNPIETGWTTKEHRNMDEWENWMETGLNIGVRCGAVSGITVIDIDQDPIPEEIKAIMGNTLMQKTKKGCHLFYKYDSDIPKTELRSSGYEIDIETDGGQIVVYPSIVEGVGRKFISETEIAVMPAELKDFLLSKIKSAPKEEVKPGEPIDFENIEIDKLSLKNNNLSGCCNNTFLKLGGILRKELNPRETEFVLRTFNYTLLDAPMDEKSLKSMCRELTRYTSFDEEDLAREIVSYLKIKTIASEAEIEIAVLGERAKGENKKRMARVLQYLLKEERIVKSGRDYAVLEQMDWTDTLFDSNKPLDFKVPYFHDYAHFSIGDLLVIGGKNKFGKCHQKGTKILMGDGALKKVENIEEGDTLQGVNNTKRKVKRSLTGYGKMYKISPTNNDSFVVNDEHILCLVNITTEEKSFITVKEYLTKNITFKKLNLLYRDTVEWKEQKLPVDPYFLGLWLGDGSSRGSEITTIDTPIINWLKKYGKKLSCKLKEYKNKDRCHSFRITAGRTQKERNKSVQSKLRKLNLLNNKHIPQIYKINSRKNRLELLAGLIDSDGYLTKKSNFEFSFKSYTLAKDIVFLARSLGYSAKIKKNAAMFNTIRYRFHITGPCEEIPTILKRKVAKKKKNTSHSKNQLHSGFKIKYVGEEVYYGFLLNGDHLYLLDNFIVNHNTGVAMNIVKRIVEQGIKPYYIYSEGGGRYQKYALELGLKEGDFWKVACFDPEKVILKPNSVVVYDWLMPKDFARTDKIFNQMVEQLEKTKSFMICFVQLKEDATSSFFACVDPKTKILTEGGWKNYKKINKNDKVANFNSKTEEIYYSNIKGINEYDYDGEMINLENKYLSQLLTPNHKMLLKYKRSNAKKLKYWWDEEWRTELAKDVTPHRGVRLPLAGVYNGNSNICSDFAELIGWIVAEGTIDKRKGNYIRISQSNKTNPAKVKKIEGLIQRLNFAYTKQMDSSQLVTFYFKTKSKTQKILYKEIWKWITKDKIPKITLLHINLSAMNALYNGLIDGDGHIYSEKSQTFYQKNKKIVDWFRILCTHLGYRTFIYKSYSINPSYPDKEKCLIYQIRILQQNWKNMEPSSHGATYHKTIKKKKYKGKVWCPVTESGFWIAKRNDKIFITGNSNMIGQYPCVLAKYLYEDDGNGEYTKFTLDLVRDPKQNGKKFEIPCKYNFDTKEVLTISEIEENKDEKTS